MKKIGFQMRKVVATIACFTVAMFASCEKAPVDKDNVIKLGNGIGSIEFQGKSYPLNESRSYKIRSWYPPPLGITFYYTDGQSYDINRITVLIIDDIYTTWQTLELPSGVHENLSVELSVNNYEKQGMSSPATRPTTKMEVNKFGDDYDITLTGKTLLYRESYDTLHDFKMTWKGKIKVMENNDVPLR